ncbi:MAG: DUF502 domain-containing protein [Deltaproteobacteria bacterium]|nr:DUF502 domain-containing protein [Deltaproteobacteria bacterium]
MEKFKIFLRTSVLGGTVVVLPVAIMVLVFKWIYYFVTDLIQPLTNVVLHRSQIPEISADIFVVVIIVMGCFLIGVVVKTRLGGALYHHIENRILKIAPGYSLIKETVVQILGSKTSPFSSVALARVYGNDTLVSAFITDRHPDGSYTLFVPTAPNPTSGNVFHLKGEYVYPIKVPVEIVMKSIISCGAGSTKLIEAYKKQYIASSPPP